RGCAIRIVWCATRMEIVYTDIFSFVRVPTWLSKERRHVTLRAVCLAFEDRFSAGGSCSIKTAFGRRRWRNRQLIELKRCQFRGHHVGVAPLVSKTSSCGNGIFNRVV